VLVVDDDPFNREVAEQILCNAGLAVSVAGDGPAAINALKRDRFALILMDMQMPGMDGLRTTGEIRRLPNGAQTPVVALTGNAFAEDRARCLAAGMDDFLVKPFDAAEFYAMVLRWLDMDGRRGQTSDR
jgi:CheY-like chemotaxis protein